MKYQLPRVAMLMFIGLTCLVLVAHLAADESATTQPTPKWPAKADASLSAATAGGVQAEFLVVLTDQADLSAAANVRHKTERGRYVYETMTAIAARSQAPLRAWLDARGANYRPYWIRNMIWVRGDRDLVLGLAGRAEVDHVYANEWQRIQLPAPDIGITPPEIRRAGEIEWNIALVNAPYMWARGFTGQGAVIGGQDTGYDWQHPAIMAQYRGWNGIEADHDYNWHDAIRHDFPDNGTGNRCGFDLAEPCDDDGHGTHTMGTMVGQAPDRRIGMAPDAKWIGCRNMEAGWGSPVTYTECFEWFIAPYPVGGDSFIDGDPAKAPHVINNSWSCPVDEGCTTADILRDVVETVVAAGIMTIQAAGNYGSSCGSVQTPPAVYDASFTVGATNYADNIAYFSSRGPVLVDESDRRKPDIVAPGEGVLSAIPGDAYTYLSGTSMAAPHVAGLVALLISADPGLAGHVTELEDVITQSAVAFTTDEGCGEDTPASVPNNVYGWGRIDAAAAFALLDIKEPAFTLLLPAAFSEPAPMTQR